MSRERYDCTICLGPISMRPEKAENRVWDTDVPPGGWAHRWCWTQTHEPVALLLAEVFGSTMAKTRQERAPKIIEERGDLIVRRPSSPRSDASVSEPPKS